MHVELHDRLGREGAEADQRPAAQREMHVGFRQHVLVEVAAVVVDGVGRRMADAVLEAGPPQVDQRVAEVGTVGDEFDGGGHGGREAQKGSFSGLWRGDGRDGGRDLQHGLQCLARRLMLLLNTVFKEGIPPCRERITPALPCVCP